jgi:hypothetical protein
MRPAQQHSVKGFFAAVSVVFFDAKKALMLAGEDFV